MAEENIFEENKKNYIGLQKKYALLSYILLHEDFDIEKIMHEKHDTLLREIRKVMVDKVVSYLRFVEMLLNPQTAPLFFLMIVKHLEGADRKNLEEIYHELGKIELDVLGVDIEYSENSEAVFIKRVSSEWPEVKKKVKLLSNTLQSAWEKKIEKKERGYLG
ncbi:MAG: hypothetical protein AABX65_04635 [Nanoarchaeota archaeon]